MKKLSFFNFFADDEIHVIRKNFQDRLEAEKTKIIEEYEGEDGKLATKLTEQRKEIDEKVKILTKLIKYRYSKSSVFRARHKLFRKIGSYKLKFCFC